MQRKFVTNLALVLLLNLLIKPFWLLGIEVAVQNTVGTTQYGFYYAIFNFSFIFNILLDLGITNFNNKNISQNNHLLGKHLASIIFLRILLAGIFVIVTLTGGFIIGYTPAMLQMLAALIFNQILLSYILYLRSNLAGLHLFRSDSIASVLDRFIMIILCGYLLIFQKDDFKINWFIYAQTTGYVISAIIITILVLRKAKIRKLQWRWPFFLMILKKSLPYAILVLLMTSAFRFDGVMLERLLPFREGAQEAGIYAAAFRLLDASNQIAFLFAGLLLPIFSRMVKLRENVEEMVRLSFSLLVVPAFIVAITSFYFSFNFMDLLYKGEHVDESAAVFKILMWCFVPISSTYIFGTLLTANGNLKQLNIMAGCGMLLNIGLNFYLIPRYSAIGAAISSITTQTFTALAQILMASRTFHFRFNRSLFFTLVIFVASVLTVNYLVSMLELGWVSRIVLSACISFAIAFMLRLISIRNIYRIVRYDE